MSHPPILLGLNIDHAATLRQARYRQAGRSCGGTVEPDPVQLALLAESAGADGITVHLREDRRHIQDRDVERLRESVRTRLNLEMACTGPMLEFALAIHPDTACLVPENRQEVTTEGGLEVAGREARVGPIVESLQAAGISVSLFIDPDPAQIRAAAALGSRMVELHTGSWAQAWGDPSARRRELERLRAGAELGRGLGLIVNAGHGINYHNVAELCPVAPWHEFNIGHSILSRALASGLPEAVREMKRLLSSRG